MIKAGSLDRTIELQRQESSQDSSGGPVSTYTTFARVPANVRPLSGRERFLSGAAHSEREARFLIRWMTGIDETMRILHDGLTWQISGIAEVGRREGLEITAVAVK